MAVPYDRTKLLFDERWEGFPPYRVCSKCKKRKEKYEFHVSRIGVRKRTGEPYFRINSWCRPCVKVKDKAVRARKHKATAGTRVPTDRVLNKVYVLYGACGSFEELTRRYGLSLGTVASIFGRTHLRLHNAEKIEAAYADLCTGSTDEQRRAWHDEAVAKRTQTETVTKIRKLATDTLRVCVKCRKQQPVEAFVTKSTPNVCATCTALRRRAKDGTDPNRIRVPITDDIRSLVRFVYEGYTKQQLASRGIWNSSFDKILDGRATYTTPYMIEKYQAAEAELLAS